MTGDERWLWRGFLGWVVRIVAIAAVGFGAAALLLAAFGGGK